MDDDARTLTHCPSCGKDVDKLRAGAVGIFSGKMSYFCSRECRDLFASSGRDAARPAGPAAGPASPPAQERKQAAAGEAMLPLLVSPSTRASPSPRRDPAEDRRPEVLAVSMRAAPEPLVHSPRSQLPRWLGTSALLGGAILAVWMAVARGWLEAGQALALVMFVPACLLGVLNAVLEWRATSVRRAVDEILVVAAVLVFAVPGLHALGRGDGERLVPGVLAPIAVLAVVWLARAMEALASSGLEQHPELSPVHAPGTLARLVGLPHSFGRSRMARIVGRTALALSLASLPAAAAVVLGSWVMAGRPGIAHHWSMAAAVALSLSPRLVRNVLTPVLAACLLRGRHAGILFQSDRSFEKAGRTNVMLFRKQGVLLAAGRDVIEFHTLGELPRETVLALVASCEEIASGNEIAEALMRFARGEGVRPGDTRMARHIPSRGIHSTSPFGEIFVGNRLFLIENGISVGRGETAAQEAEKRGHTAIFISVNRTIEAVAILANRLRPTAKQAVDLCHRIGLTTVLITGDSTRTAESLGSLLGVDQIRPEIGASSREEEVARLRDAGLRIAMLGSLADGPPRGDDEADLRIGIGWDGDADVDPSWDVVVTGDDLSRAVQGVELALRSRRFVMANVSIAVLVGGLCFGFAASGLASPLVVALLVNLAGALVMAVRPGTGS